MKLISISCVAIAVLQLVTLFLINSMDRQTSPDNRIENLATDIRHLNSAVETLAVTVVELESSINSFNIESANQDTVQLLLEQSQQIAALTQAIGGAPVTHKPDQTADTYGNSIDKQINPPQSRYTPEEIQLGVQTSYDLVTQALSSGRWTFEINNELIAQADKLSRENKAELLDQIQTAINNQELRLEAPLNLPF